MLFSCCHSGPGRVSGLQFDPSRTAGDDRLKKWLVPTIDVLYAFSGTLSEGVALVFAPAKIVFAGVGFLLLAAKDVTASQDILVDIFGRIESFFVRLDSYTEALDILSTATKEMEQSRAKKIIQKVAGRTDLEDGPRKLDKLTNEKVAMASVQFVKVTHKIDNKVTGIDDGVRGVDVKVQVVNDNVKAVGDKVQRIADDGKATATEVRSILRQTADDVDNVKRNQLRDNLRKWQSPPDPSTNHNIAGDRQREGIMG
ncbi:hypothetical protein EDB84DRAFT_1571881 [Lactarius hengduanensis]|nr:hypothetical protein EDB84DRAFT_1571881 [Lactarius hengduanensis]